MDDTLVEVVDIEECLEGNSFEIGGQSMVAPQSRDADGGGRDGVEEIQSGGRCLDLDGGEIGLSPTLFYQVGMLWIFV